MKDHTQYGEKIILDNYFGHRLGFFLDVGAADGITHSNTYHLAQQGWQGILVEPCRHFVSKLKEIYSDSTNVKIFDGALSDFNGITKFYVYEAGNDSQISTIQLPQKKSIEVNSWFSGKFTDEYDVNVLTPSNFCNIMQVPKRIEFVDIDAEGSDMKILNSWPWNQCEVELFCIEHSMGKDVIINFMDEKGYKPLAITGGNHLFIKQD